MVSTRYFRGIRLREGGRGLVAEPITLTGSYAWVNANRASAASRPSCATSASTLIEAGGIPKPTNQLDRNRLAVPVAAHIEQMNLERAVELAEGRTRAEVHHSAEHAARASARERRIPLRRKKFARRRQLRC